ncbi:MAG TPA: reverse transcriptase family protein [Blastocatellia bacterium]|nr:reverse transcriptase family protein [Blastocatellia bacterium]
MSERARTREELLEAARQTSREEVILEEMIRLGFWPAEGEMPHDPADEVRRKGELRRELSQLRAQFRRLHNEAALLKEARNRRLAESRRKRQETNERREREREEQAEQWRLRKQQEIVYLGPGVSAGLNHSACDEGRLASYGLPRLDTARDIAEAMGITVGELRFLAFSRKTSTVSHYVRFKIPKKTGGHRLISAPQPRLKQAQRWILQNILERVEAHDAAHGFRAGRSIVSNARTHVGAEVIINLDLKDFFPSVEYNRVKGLFRSLGYSEAAASIFGLLATGPDVEEVELDGKTYYVATTQRRLPQGAPTSPALTNIMCRRLDRRLSNMASELGFTYTRYADDLTFSASGDDLRNICNVLRRAGDIIAHEGFAVHPKKTRVLRRARRQEVTGIVVNSYPNVCRRELRKFRAVLYQVEKDGPEGKRWGNSRDVIASLLGFANYVYMVNPEKGAELQSRVRAIIDKYGWQPRKMERRAKPQPAPESPTPEKRPADKKWWKLW